jgi:hypothetical protein
MNYEDLFDLDEDFDPDVHIYFKRMFDDVAQLEDEEDELWKEEDEY